LKWTPEEEETLRTLWGGLPARTCSIIGKANRMGLCKIKPEVKNEWLREGYRRWMVEAGL